MVAPATTPRFAWVILALMFSAQLSCAFATQATPPLSPLFVPELGLTKTEVGLFSSAAYAGAWIVMIFAGPLTDRYGVRVAVSIGQVVFGALMLTMAATSSFVQAVAVMFAVGVGRGFTIPSLSKGVSDWFPPRFLGTAMGIKQTGVPMAALLSASILPSLGLAFGWRGAIATVGLLVIAGGTLSALFYRDPARTNSAPLARVSMRSGLAQVMRIRKLWSLSTVSLLYLLAQTGLTSYLALYMGEVVLARTIPDDSTRVVAAGGMLAICGAGGTVGRIGWGIVSDRLYRGRRMSVIAFIGAISAIAAAATALVSAATPLWAIGLLAFFFGANAMGWNGLFQAVVMESVDRRFAGTGVGLSMTIMQAGTVLGPPAFGVVVDTSGSYSMGWFFIAGVYALGSLVSAAHMRGEASVER